MDRISSRQILALVEATSVTGPAKNLLGFARWLQSREGLRCGLRLAVVTFERASAAIGTNGFVDAARAAGVDTHVVRERFRYDLSVLPQLRQLITKIAPDIIQTHSNKSHFLVRLLSAAPRDFIWLAFHHGDTHTNLRQKAYNELDRLTLRSADGVITVCQAFVPALKSRGVKPERIRVLHNAAGAASIVSHSEARKLRDELAIGYDEAVILSIGRLSREKGQEYLIRAAARLPPLQKSWKLVFVGTGPDFDQLKKLTDTLGLTKRVSFVGLRANVAPFYAIANVFALPSLSEGSSNVLLEAMIAGVPIVATHVGGNPEIALHGQTALLVPPASPESLADALARLLTDDALAANLASAGQNRAATEYSVSRYQQRLASFYAEAFASIA